MDHDLTDFDKDQIAEIVNIGAGNAATALSHMLGKRVQIDVPKSYVGKTEYVLSLLGKSDDTVLAIYLKMTGDISGALAIVFSKTAALKFTELLANIKKTDIADLTDDEISSLREVGNILLGASLTALSKFLSLNVGHTIPDHTIDMLGAIMDTVISDVGKGRDDILAVRIRLILTDNETGGELFYLFDPHSTTKILQMTAEVLSKTRNS